MRMADEWFVSVQEKEYGPVDLDTLLEWKAEGRLLPENPVRKEGEITWSSAATIPDLFAPAAVVSSRPDQPFRRRTFSEILADTFRIYRKGFPQFFLLALLVGVPSLGLKLSLAFVSYREGEAITSTTRIASILAVVMLTAVIVAWPIFVGGLQFAAADIAAGRSIRFADLLRRTINFWPRIGRLCLFVYGSYIFWTLLPILVITALASAGTVIMLLLALLALASQVYVAGRLFINFMFWQQACTIGQLESVDALRESKELARSRTELPRLQRPLYRGAIIASLWLVVLLMFSTAIQLPFMLVRFSGITNFEEAYALMQNMINASTPDAMTIATYALSSLVHAVLRPLLGIAFVVLYFDAKA
jgi:hypothetical protein